MQTTNLWEHQETVCRHVENLTFVNVEAVKANQKDWTENMLYDEKKDHTYAQQEHTSEEMQTASRSRIQIVTQQLAHMKKIKNNTNVCV